MSSYLSHLGILERLQNMWELHLSVGMRFALLALVIVSLVAAIGDILQWMIERRDEERGRIPRDLRLTYFINRVVICLAVLGQAPAAFYRLGRTNIDYEFAYALQLVSTALLISYFLTDELVRLLANGTKLKSAAYRCIPLGVAVLLLFLLGVNVDVRS